MKFSHTEEQREDQHLDILTDEENGLRIVVSRLGAELVSLARVNEAGEWTGFLYRDNDLSAPSQGWANHATVMGYYLHRLKDGRSLYRGPRNQRRQSRFSPLQNMALRRNFSSGKRRLTGISNHAE